MKGCHVLSFPIQAGNCLHLWVISSITALSMAFTRPCSPLENDTSGPHKQPLNTAHFCIWAILAILLLANGLSVWPVVMGDESTSHWLLNIQHRGRQHQNLRKTEVMKPGVQKRDFAFFSAMYCLQHGAIWHHDKQLTLEVRLWNWRIVQQLTLLGSPKQNSAQRTINEFWTNFQIWPK